MHRETYEGRIQDFGKGGQQLCTRKIFAHAHKLINHAPNCQNRKALAAF